MMSDHNDTEDDAADELMDELMADIAEQKGPDTELDATTTLTEREEREAVYRHVFMGQTYRDIGDILGVSHSTVGTVMDAYKSASGTELETSILNQFTDEDDPDPSEGAIMLTYSGEDADSEDGDADDSPEVMTDGGQDAPTVQELRDEFNMDPDDPPCSIHERDDGRPYWFAGNDYHARKRVRERLEAAGYTWEHPEDGRFHNGEDVSRFIITGRADADSEADDGEPDVETDGGEDTSEDGGEPGVRWEVEYTNPHGARERATFRGSWVVSWFQSEFPGDVHSVRTVYPGEDEDGGDDGHGTFMASDGGQVMTDGGRPPADVLADVSEGERLALTLDDGRELTGEVTDVQAVRYTGLTGVQYRRLTLTDDAGEFTYRVTVGKGSDGAGPKVTRTTFADVAVSEGHLSEDEVDDPDEWVDVDEGHVTAVERSTD